MDNIQLANIQHIQNACKQDKLVIFIGAVSLQIQVFPCGKNS